MKQLTLFLLAAIALFVYSTPSHAKTVKEILDEGDADLYRQRQERMQREMIELQRQQMIDNEYYQQQLLNELRR